MISLSRYSVRVCVHHGVCVCVRGCVRVCVHASVCVHICVHLFNSHLHPLHLDSPWISGFIQLPLQKKLRVRSHTITDQEHKIPI